MPGGVIENHRGAHFTLLVFPDGKLILATPDRLRDRERDEIMGAVQRWLRSTDNHDALVIGDCLVQIQPVSAREFEVT